MPRWYPESSTSGLDLTGVGEHRRIFDSTKLASSQAIVSHRRNRELARDEGSACPTSNLRRDAEQKAASHHTKCWRSLLKCLLNNRIYRLLTQQRVVQPLFFLPLSLSRANFWAIIRASRCGQSLWSLLIASPASGLYVFLSFSQVLSPYL